MTAKNPIIEAKRTGQQWKSIYLLSGVTAIIVVCAGLLDID